LKLSDFISLKRAIRYIKIAINKIFMEKKESIRTNKTPTYIENPKFKEKFKSKRFEDFNERYFSGFNKKGFSRIEIKHLFWSWLAISFAFANLLKGEYYPSFFGSFIISSVAVGTGFLLHEIAHKFVSQKFHLRAEFRAFFPMLLLAVVLSYTGFIFAAPGAVMIMGKPSKKQNGLISIAGPLTNIILALIFFGLLFMNFQNELMLKIFFYGFIINVWLALFNLIPFAIFDGKKIFEWNKFIWAGCVIVCIVLFFMQGIVPKF